MPIIIIQHIFLTANDNSNLKTNPKTILFSIERSRAQIDVKIFILR